MIHDHVHRFVAIRKKYRHGHNHDHDLHGQYHHHDDHHDLHRHDHHQQARLLNARSVNFSRNDGNP